MNYLNYTGREIKIYSAEDTYVYHNLVYLRNTFVTPVLSLSPLNSLDSLPEVFSDFEVHDSVRFQKFVDAEAVEEFAPDFDINTDVLIVPNIWAQVARLLDLVPRKARIATVYGLIRDRHHVGTSIGCLGLEWK